MGRPAISARALTFAVLAGPVMLAGCATTSTYGTGEVPEMALFREMTGGFMSKKEKQSIDYQPRAPLVLPASAEQLPPPVEAASTANASWPVDPNATVLANAALDGDPRNDVSQAEYRRLRPLSGIVPDARPPPSSDKGSVRDDYYTNIVHGGQRREEFRKAVADAKGYGGTTERRYLTDPPLTYREPAPTAPTESSGVKKKKGFFLTRWLTGG